MLKYFYIVFIFSLLLSSCFGNIDISDDGNTNTEKIKSPKDVESIID